MIITNNLKDFPNDYLGKFGLTAKSADDFITDTIDLNPEIAVKAFCKMVIYKANPELTELEVFEVLRENK